MKEKQITVDWKGIAHCWETLVKENERCKFALEMLYSKVRHFMYALNPQVNPNNPEEIKIKETYFNESDDRELFNFIERFVYEDELKGEINETK